MAGEVKEVSLHDLSVGDELLVFYASGLVSGFIMVPEYSQAGQEGQEFSYYK